MGTKTKTKTKSSQDRNSPVPKRRLDVRLFYPLVHGWGDIFVSSLFFQVDVLTIFFLCFICVILPFIRRKSLMAHGRDESANSCTMCGFNYVLKKRARFYELISYRGKPPCFYKASVFYPCKVILRNEKQDYSSSERIVGNRRTTSRSEGRAMEKKKEEQRRVR